MSTSSMACWVSNLLSSRQSLYGFYIADTIKCVVLLSVFTSPVVFAQSDDFDDGNDDGWTRYDGLGTATYSFPDGGYRIEGSFLGSAYLSDQPEYTDFLASVDLVDWDNNLNQVFGLGGRVSDVAPGTTDGYLFLYFPRSGQANINTISNDAPSLTPQTGDPNVVLDPTRDYRMTFSGVGSTLVGQIFDLNDLSTPLVSRTGIDPTYARGISSVIASSTGPPNKVDVTFDNFAVGMPESGGSSPAPSVDFRAFTAENYPRPDAGDIADWVVSDNGVTATERNHAWNTVFYGPENILNSRISGKFNLGGPDDDLAGFVLGFNPGDAEGVNPAADYILIDWKATDQSFDFSDPAGRPPFHSLTAGTLARTGLALSQVRGLPTADELWGHVDDPQNPGGGVIELARASNLGSVGYDLAGKEYEFELIYQANRIQVFVDGSLELDVSGDFGDGRFGLYEAFQIPSPVWTEFDIEKIFLLAGDADQDLDFDQRDLVQVQIAAKYLSGLLATWGDGDWDGAPGGSPGSPPAGNGQFDQQDIVAALSANAYLAGPYAALQPNGAGQDGQTSIMYNAATGEVAVDAPAGLELTSINIESAAGIFTGAAARNLGGSFDNDADANIFKATFGGSFGSISFGNVAQAGLSEQFVLDDLAAVGSLAGGGALGQVDLIYVPEPATISLLVLVLTVGIMSCRRF